MVSSPCCPRDSQESSPAPQFESISSSALNPFYGSTLTSIHNYWKNHSFDQMDLSTVRKGKSVSNPKYLRNTCRENSAICCCEIEFVFCRKARKIGGFSSGTNDKEFACQLRRHKRHRFSPWVGKVPWRRARQPTPVFLPRDSAWTEESGGLQSIGLQRVGHDCSDLACMHA